MTVDVALSHIDEARNLEQRVPFAARLVRIEEQASLAEHLLQFQEKRHVLTVERGDLPAIHRALHVAAGHTDHFIFQVCHKIALIKNLARIRDAALNALADHDDVPMHERNLT
jgi:hypothetical protein